MAAQSGFSSARVAAGGDGAAPSSRRQRVVGYLKAANELRQAYQSQWSSQKNELGAEYNDAPGAYPDVEIARSGDEQMVLFPSYARRLTPKPKKEAPSRRDSWSQTIDEYRGASEEDHSPDDSWDGPDVADAVVDVDVRGWIYAPGREPMSKKHRLMITLARQLSGIQAPSGATNGQGSDRATSKGTDEYVDKQMQDLVETAEKDADQMWKSSNLDRSRGNSNAAPMTKDELSIANAHLMERLRPFLTNPVAGLGVMVFFFNDTQSVSRTIRTDESGHFILRAALSFVPTHVRVLASEDLCAARPIDIIEPVGISVISDIDDTVKHSAITSGAKEMFRNTFVRELGDLTIEGVSDWYQQLAKRGVGFHYVSNAPWQLYPLLEKYFKMVGLPPGSFHLKQYTGMLQGIFEPTAERKRGSLEQILRDFPGRKFILVGDSGEADLEVYTDIVLANPGRIMGIFIRDVTTVDQRTFFDKSVGHLEKTSARSRSTPQLADHSDSLSDRPALPPRRPRETPGPADDVKSIDNEDLIDLRDEEDSTATDAQLKPSKSRVPPPKPSKPSALRTTAGVSDFSDSPTSTGTPPTRRKPAPPVPPRRASTAKADPLIDIDPPPPVSRTHTEPANTEDPQPPAVPIRTKPPPPTPPPRRTNTPSSNSSTSNATTASRPAPPLPAKPSYPVSAAQAALQYASERLNLSASPSTGLRQSASNQSLGRTSSGYSSAGESGMPPAPLPNKREELWRRRWERASDVLEKNGVLLGSWRVGSDAQPVCTWLVDEALQEMKGDGSKKGAGHRD